MFECRFGTDPEPTYPPFLGTPLLFGISSVGRRYCCSRPVVTIAIALSDLFVGAKFVLRSQLQGYWVMGECFMLKYKSFLRRLHADTYKLQFCLVQSSVKGEKPNGRRKYYIWPGEGSRVESARRVRAAAAAETLVLTDRRPRPVVRVSRSRRRHVVGSRRAE